MTPLPLGTGLSVATAALSIFMTLPMLALAGRRQANAWLALLVLAFGALSFCDSGVLRGPLFGVLDWSLAALGPLYYGYVRSVTGLGNGRRQAWHFLPMLVAAGAFAWLRESLIALPSGVYPPASWNRIFDAVLYGSQASAVTYMGIVLWRLREHRRRVRACFSEVARHDLAWLAWLTGATIVLLLLWLATALTSGAMDDALRCGRLALLFFIGWYGMGQAVVFVPDIAPAATAIPAEPEPPQAPVPARASKYARSGLNQAAIQLIGERLASRMQASRDYLESDITLAELAERVGASPQWLSQYFNEVLGSSFFDYINAQRVAAVQMAMRDVRKSSQPLLELAFEAGFNSKSTFNLAFKKITGMAPSRWRAAQAGTSEPIR